MANNANKKEPDEDFGKSVIRWLGVGFEFALVVLACLWLGYKLDQRRGTSPKFMMLFFFIGLVWMIYTMLKRAGVFKKDDEGDE